MRVFPKLHVLCTQLYRTACDFVDVVPQPHPPQPKTIAETVDLDDTALAQMSDRDAGRRYLAGVYRDDRLLRSHNVSDQQFDHILQRLAFVYHSGRRAVTQCLCKASFHDWRPRMCDTVGGCSHVALVHTEPNLLHPLSYYGFWLASSLPAPLHSDAVVSRVRTEAWWVRHGFVPDHTWAEMLRISPTWSIGEGGLFGCWFEVSSGSGVGVNVGRSLRAIHRTHLAAALGFNVTALFDRPIRGREHLWEAWRRGRAAATIGSPSNRTSAMTNASSTTTTTTSMWPPPMCSGLSLTLSPLRRGGCLPQI